MRILVAGATGVLGRATLPHLKADHVVGLTRTPEKQAAEARRLVIESVAFALERAAASALEEMEQTALDSPLDVLILRFGRFWGPGTWYQEQPEKPAIHIDDAGARAAKLLTSAPPGTPHQFLCLSAVCGIRARASTT
jgi:NAD(P)-dependent dehydrogenase (short-subunit alcohol dehydrogenase family)